MKKYKRSAIEVQAVKYEPGRDMEDGFMPWSSVVTNGWIVTDKLVRIEREDGRIVCPFIQNRRGIIFIREGDYLITEGDGERHVCGEDKFHLRYTQEA